MSLQRSGFDPLVQRLIDVLEQNATDLPLRIGAAPDRIDFRAIKVMISSPIKFLAQEREGLYQEIRRMPEVEPLMFEKNFDTGTPNIDESLKLVDESDFFFAIFDPAYDGTKINDGPFEDKTYSQIEFERAKQRQERTGWPLIFVFRKSGTEGQLLASWQQDALRAYAETPVIRPQGGPGAAAHDSEPTFSTLRALLDTAVGTLNAHIIRIRGARAKYLWKRTEELANDLALRDQELNAGKENHDQLILTMKEAHERSVKIINETNHAANDHQQQQIRGLQDRLDSHHARTARMISLGAAMGVVSIVAALLALGRVLPKVDVTALIKSIEAAGDIVASSVGTRSLFAANMEIDPILQSRKIKWAEEIAPGFECSGTTRQWSLTKVSDTFPLRLMRDNVCSPYAPLRLEIMVSGNSPCAYKTDLKSDDWDKLRNSLKSARLRITQVSVTGHASREQVDGPCESIPKGLREERRSVTSHTTLSFPQDRITSNRELAYVRAWAVAQVIGTSTKGNPDKSDDPTPIDIDQLGVLDAHGEPRTDRKVTLGLTIQREAPKAPG